MPRIRTDIVDVYVFRRWPADAAGRVDVYLEFLQLFREGGRLSRTWQPVMGTIEAGETAHATAVRELWEEVGLKRSSGEILGMWALEQVSPFFLAQQDEIVLSPRFAVEVGPAWVPRLNEEHSAFRWIAGHQASRFFMWPGQLAAVKEVLDLLRFGSEAEGILRVDAEG